jgi:hypothetical protein
MLGEGSASPAKAGLHCNNQGRSSKLSVSAQGEVL